MICSWRLNKLKTDLQNRAICEKAEWQKNWKGQLQEKLKNGLLKNGEKFEMRLRTGNTGN